MVGRKALGFFSFKKTDTKVYKFKYNLACSHCIGKHFKGADRNGNYTIATTLKISTFIFYMLQEVPL